MKIFYFYGFLIFLLPYTTILVDSYKDLPTYFPKCKRTDPNLNKCLLNATETVRPFLLKGVPEIHIYPIEPLIIPSITLQQGTQALNFKAVLHNVFVKGLSRYRFSKFDFDVPNLQFFCTLDVGPLDVEGDYTVTGKILLAPIQGNGTFTAGIANAHIDVYQKIELIKKKGLKYANATITKTTIQVSDPQAYLNGLFNGNAELNKATNSVINDNINELFLEFKPVLEQSITDVMENAYLKNIEYNVPFDILYAV